MSCCSVSDGLPKDVYVWALGIGYQMQLTDLCLQKSAMIIKQLALIKRISLFSLQLAYVI